MRVAAALTALVLAAGCSVGSPPSAPPDESDDAVTATRSTRVDVDTRALRAAKRAAGIETCPPGDGAAVEGGLPRVSLPCLGGGPDVALSALRGPLVINLFAQWCEPCRDELPFYQRLHERAGDEVRVLGIDYLDTQPDGAIELAEASGVTFPLLADPDGALRQLFRISGLPGVVFVDRAGRVTNPAGRPTFTVIRSYDELAALVREHLGVVV